MSTVTREIALPGGRSKSVIIHTYYEHPPIPCREMDWAAVDDGYDGAEDSHCPVGTGRTEQEAIDDLCAQIQERDQ